MTIKPPSLKTGQKIGIIAPAGPVKQSELLVPISMLQDNGYQVITSLNLFKKNDYLAGDDESRLSDIHRMFEDKDIKAILCARGGYGSLRIIDSINYDLIHENPKIFIGYSDITALLLAIHNKTGLVVFHGPVVRELNNQNKDNLSNLINVLSGSSPKIELIRGRSLKAGKSQGPLLGGNLSVIASMVGTPFLHLLKGSVLFIEERGESLYRIDRMLTQMRLNGLLNNLAGIAIGSFEDCGEISNIENLLVDITKDFDYPVLSGLPVGHGIYNRVIPIGIQASINAESMSISFREKFFNN